MPKQMVSIRLEEEVALLLRTLSAESDKVFGTHLSQAQIVEKAVREMAALQPHQAKPSEAEEESRE